MRPMCRSRSYLAYHWRGWTCAVVITHLALVCLYIKLLPRKLTYVCTLKNNKTQLINLHFWLAYIEWRSSGDVVVKLLACWAIRSGVWFLISPRRFQRLVISCFQLAILPKYRYFKAAHTKQPTNVEWNMNILVNAIAWSSIANDNRFSALCKHYLILPHISRQRSIILKNATCQV